MKIFSWYYVTGGFVETLRLLDREMKNGKGLFSKSQLTLNSQDFLEALIQ